MRVEKIDIVKTIIDIPKDKKFLDFFKVPAHLGREFKEGEAIPETLSFEKETYEVQKIVVPGVGVKNYLVKVSDRKLFEELVIITQTRFENVIYEAEERGVHKGIDTGITMTKNVLRALPWWKLLFRRF